MVNSPGNKAAKKAKTIIRTPSIEAPKIIITRNPGIALILGGADCVHTDMEAALRLFTPACVIAINNIGYTHPGLIDHWVTMHPDKMGAWVKQRRANGFPDAGTLWRPRHRTGSFGLVFRDCSSFGGSSGLLAVNVCILALEMRGVLAGVPMQKERNHFDSAKPWNDCVHYTSAWKRYLPQMHGKVKSMSGWTAEILGRPDGVWLDAQRRAAPPGTTSETPRSQR